MASFNKVLLMGNLTRDPELRYTASGAAVASFGLAVNRKYKAGDEWKEEVCFVDITVWGRQAETCGEYLKKGSPALIEGRLQMDQWENQQGEKRSKLKVRADRVQFLSSGSGGGGGGRSGGGASDQEAPPPSEPPADLEEDGDDLPF